MKITFSLMSHNSNTFKRRQEVLQEDLFDIGVDVRQMGTSILAKLLKHTWEHVCVSLCDTLYDIYIVSCDLYVVFNCI